MSERSPEYQLRVARRIHANLREFEREKSILTNCESSAAGILLAWFTGGLVTGSFISGGSIFAGIVGAIGGWALVYILARFRFWRRAPYELDEERRAELTAAKQEAQANVAAMAAEHKAELRSLRDQLTATIEHHAEEGASLREQLAAAIRDHGTECDSLRQQLAAALSPIKAFSVTAYTDHLSHLYDSSLERLTAVFAKTEFALLKVTNTSPRGLGQVVARCRFKGDTEDFCVWSLRTGTPPFEAGTHEADLSAGNSRLLAIARGFGSNRLWARLPPEGEPFRLSTLLHVVSRDNGIDEDEISVVSSSGDPLTLPEEIPITVTFQATDFHQEERFVLRFSEDGKPLIEPVDGGRDEAV